jgi:DNA-binding transcriptional LysR family regulator
MDLNRVTTFLRVVESGTFTSAARALSLPTSSVSRSVAKLEGELGMVLLERTTRKVALTDAGRAYYERARDAVAGLDEAVLLASEAAREPSGVVHLAAPPELAGKLAGLVGTFVRRHPKIHVDVITTARGAELVGAEVDIAIVLGRLEDSALIVRKVGVTLHKLYAASEYIERRGVPRTPADLSRHDAVLYRGKEGRAIWELSGPRGKEAVEVTGTMSGDSFQFVMDAVIGGHGIGLLPEQCLVHAPVGLVQVLPKWGTLGAVQSLVHPTRHLPKRVKLLREFLTEQLTSACPVQERAVARSTATG